MLASFLFNLVPQRFLVMGAIGLSGLSLLTGAYFYVGHLNNKIETLQISLANETTARETAEATIKKLTDSLARGQEQINQLEEANKKAADEWAATLAIIDELDSCDAKGKPSDKGTNDAVDRLNRTNADINRMLQSIGR